MRDPKWSLIIRAEKEKVFNLTWAQMERAAMIGVKRRLESIRQGLHSKFDKCAPNSAAIKFDVDIQAAMAEKFVAVALGCPDEGEGVNTFKAPDIGDNIQVRQTDRWDGCLIVRDDDKDGQFYVCVVGRCPHFRIAGWMLGMEAKQDQWRRSPNGGPPAYFVPQENLYPFLDLKAELDAILEDQMEQDMRDHPEFYEDEGC